MLAGILHVAGLLDRGNEALVPYAISMASRLDNRTFTLANELKAAFARECFVDYVGVWESVAQFGWIANPAPLRIPFSVNNPGIRVGRHALAIDERRVLFEPSLWAPKRDSPAAGPQDLKQVWFRAATPMYVAAIPSTRAVFPKSPWNGCWPKPSATGWPSTTKRLCVP